MNINITLRLVLWIVTAATLIYTTVVWYDYRLTRGHIVAKSRLEAARIVDVAVKDLTANLHSVEISTDIFARIISQDLPPAGELQLLLQKVVSNRRDIYGAAVAVEPGLLQAGAFAPYYFHPGAPKHYDPKSVMSYADLAVPEYGLEHQDWYRLPQQQMKSLWIDPYFDEGGGNVLMATYAVPLVKKGKPFGVVTADITMERLHDYLGRMHLGKSGFAMLLTRDGKILDHPDVTLSLKPLSQVYPQMVADSGEWSRTIAQAWKGESGLTNLPCPHISDQCLVGFSSLTATGWALVFLYPEQEMLAELRGHSVKILLIAGAGIIGLLVTVSLISRRLTLPLVALAEASYRLGEGDLDVALPVARGNDEITRLIDTFSMMRDRLKNFVAQLEKETATRSRLQGELDAAHQIQMEMLPGGGHGRLHREGLSVWANLLPAKSVGGDLYTWLDVGNNRVWLVVGDVSDKGVPAALFMARTLTLLRQYASSDLPVSEVMVLLNENLTENNDACMFVTLFCGVLDYQTGRLEFVSCGHTAPMLRRGNEVCVIEQEHGPALGLCEVTEFPTNRFQLLSGDLLYVYTDGIDEAFNRTAEQFGHERLKHVSLDARPDDVASTGEAVLAAVLSFADGAPQSDDITLMLVHWRQTPLLATAAGAENAHIESLLLPPNLPALETLFDSLTVWVAGYENDSPGLLNELKLVAEEIFVNIVNYGRLEAGEMIAVLFGKGEGCILLEFIDRGIAWNPLDDTPKPTLGLNTEDTTIGGLGVFLVQELTDRQAYLRENDANRFCVLKYIVQPTGEKS